MTTAHDPMGLLRKGQDAFNERDRDALLDTFDDDASWHEPGHNPISGDHEGRDKIWETIFKSVWDAPVRVDRHELVGTAKHATARCEFVATLGGQERRFPLLETIRAENGKVVERWSFLDDQTAFDDFLTQAQATGGG